MGVGMQSEGVGRPGPGRGNGTSAGTGCERSEKGVCYQVNDCWICPRHLAEEDGD